MKRKKTVALITAVLTFTMTACGSSTAITESASTEESTPSVDADSVIAVELPQAVMVNVNTAVIKATVFFLFMI